MADSADASNLPAALFRHWIHSREEDTGDIEVFRPEGFAFPPSFGRDGFEMRKDGQFVQEDVGLADGVVQVMGRWTALGSRRVSVSFDGTTREGYTFEIVAVDDSVLQIQREAQQAQSLTDEAQLQSFQALPSASCSRLLDFESARIITIRTFPPQHVLIVSGTKPYTNMDVELVPVTYIRQPEYWRIEVVGSLRGIGLPALAPYTVSIPLVGFIGTKGIEVGGATRSQQFNLSTAGSSQA